MIQVEKPFPFLILSSDSSTDVVLNNSPTQVVAQHKKEENQMAKYKEHQKTLALVWLWMKMWIELTFTWQVQFKTDLVY